MPEETLSFIPLLLVVGLAFAVPIALSRLPRIPVVVGEIIAGIIIGRSGLQLVHKDFTLEILAEIGFAFLMFISGLEIDFSILLNPNPRRKDKGLHPIVLAALSILITFGLATLVGFLIVQNGLSRDPWMMALILSTTSLGVVIPVLKERGLLGGHFGQTLLLAALLADFLTMLFITVYVAILSSGRTFEILLIGVLFLAFLVVYRLGIRQVNRPSVRLFIEELSGATSQIKIRGALALMMLFVVLAEFLGVELILGAFLAGTVTSLLSTPDDEDMRHNIDAMGFGFFIPLFFIMVGVEFDLPSLLSDPVALALTPVLLLAAFLMKFLSALVFRTTFPWRETLSSGALLSARLSLIIAASAIGLRLGILSEATNAAIILVAALTSTVAPLAFNWILPEIKSAAEKQMAIFGAGNFGMQVAQELKAHGEFVYLLESDASLASKARQEGFEVINSNNPMTGLDKLDPKYIQTFLILTGDDEYNYQVSKLAASMGFPQIIAQVQEPTLIQRFQQLGIQTYSPSIYRATLLATMARNPDIFSLLTSTSDSRDVREFYLRNREMVGKPLNKIVLPGDSLILAINRDGEVIIPHGTTRLEWNDRLTVLGELDALVNVKAAVE